MPEVVFFFFLFFTFMIFLVFSEQGVGVGQGVLRLLSFSSTCGLSSFIQATQPAFHRTRQSVYLRIIKIYTVCIRMQASCIELWSLELDNWFPQSSRCLLLLLYFFTGFLLSFFFLSFFLFSPFYLSKTHKRLKRTLFNW